MECIQDDYFCNFLPWDPFTLLKIMKEPKQVLFS
jgi:hypothetical protein